eukprot:190467-Pleurochrysis_carterae.AAC.1
MITPLSSAQLGRARHTHTHARTRAETRNTISENGGIAQSMRVCVRVCVRARVHVNAHVCARLWVRVHLALPRKSTCVYLWGRMQGCWSARPRGKAR